MTTKQLKPSPNRSALKQQLKETLEENIKSGQVERLGFCNNKSVVPSEDRAYVSEKMTKIENLQWRHLFQTTGTSDEMSALAD